MTDQIHPADASQAHAITQEREARLTAIGEVNAGYARFCASGSTLAEIIIGQANEARTIGLHLIELKRTSKRDFLGMFASARGKANSQSIVNFSYERGAAFIRHAERYPDPITELRAGITSVTQLMLEDEQSTRGTQSRCALNWFSSLQKVAMNLAAGFGKQREKAGEPASWSPVEQSSVKAMLRPLVALYNEIPES